MIFLIIAILVTFFLIYVGIGRPKSLQEVFQWNGGNLESFPDYIRMGTNWQSCQGLFYATNIQKYPIVLRSSRWWGDSNKLIEDLKQMTVPPGGLVVQSFGWAGLGSKEYRVYVYDQKGNPLPTNKLGDVSGAIDFCSSLNINDLGLLD